jgi:hypothetical protein
MSRIEIDKTEANARLIDAAPEMLAALKTLKSRIEECDGLPVTTLEVFDSFYREIIDEAIHKAEGV